MQFLLDWPVPISFLTVSLMTTFYRMDEKSIPNRELYAETLTRLNDLAQYRRLRIFAGNDTVPSAVWFVLLVGALFSVSYACFFGMKNIKAQYLITTTLTVTITLIYQVLRPDVLHSK